MDGETRDRQHTSVRGAGCTQRVMICEGLLALLVAATWSDRVLRGPAADPGP